MTTPILYIAFKRLDYVKKSLISILEQRQENKLIICIDGPSSKEEKVSVQEVISYIEKLDIKNVIIIKQEKNLGCERHIIKSIEYGFEKYNDLIIIEDDVVITKNFLNFIENNKNKVTIDDIAFIGRNEENTQWFSWGWYISKENWNKYFYINNIYYDWEEYKKHFKMSKDIEPIIKSQFSQQKRFTWDSQLRNNVYDESKILFYSKEFTKNIGDISSNQLRFEYQGKDKVIDTLDGSFL